MLPRSRSVVLLWSAAATISVALVACERVGLLAPTGSTITLTAPTNVLSANGSVDIMAQVLEAAGTPPHSGTHVLFTTTLGRVEPAEAETDVNGRVVVKFLAGAANGTATITASSGAATTGTTGALRIAVGTAAVGRVSLTANPSTISSNGGSSTITANVVDINGNVLGNVPVTFATSAGALSASVVNTDAGGVASTTLTTSTQATVTATVGVQSQNGGSGNGSGGTGTGTGGGSTSTQASATVTVNVNPVPTVAITPPSGTIVANQPVTFTLSIAPGANSTAQIREVTIDFGDGSRAVNLGASTGSNLSVQHRFDTDGTFTVRVTVIDTLGGVTTAATTVVVQPEPPLSVLLTASQTSSGGTTFFTFTATVIPSTATAQSFLWNFGDGSSPRVTTGPQVTHSYPTGSGAKTVSVTVTTTTGRTASTSIIVNP